MATEFKNTKALLENYGKSVVSEIKVRLRNNGKTGSGALHDSIKCEVTETGTKLSISFFMLDYGRFVDKGVQGAETGRAGDGGRSIYSFKNKMPPASAFSGWLKSNGLPASASYPIRRHIFKVGMTPTNFFTIPTTRRAKQLEKDVKIAMEKDIEASLKKTVSTKKKK